VNKTLTEQQKSWLLLVALWLGLLLLASLRPIAVPDEGRYGEIGRWMLVSGDWLTPRLNGIPFFHKPPYLYWLEALSVATFGVNELALRLVPALHAGLMLIALYLAARHISGEIIARRATLMLGTSLSFLVGGQYINHDMLVACWIGLAIWCFSFAFMAGDKPHSGLARLGFLACALGMLSKGLIGIALPGLVILLWLIATHQLKKIMYLPWVSGLSLFSAVALPWFVLAQQKYPDFFNYMFVGQQFNRYTAAVYNNPQPWWFYLLALALLLFPWMFFALAQWRRVSPTDAQNPRASMPAAWWKLCWIWLLTILLFFSIPHSKLIGYILPVLPPLTLLAALGWQRWVGARQHAARWFAGVSAVNLLIALVLMLKVGDVTRSSRTQDLAEAFACAAKPEDTLFVTDAFPYDLPLYAQTRKPMVVLGDWPQIRKNAGDGWQRELFEGADFDAQAAKVLQAFEKLSQVANTPGYWFATRSGSQLAQNTPGWQLYYKGAGWDLFRSGGSHDSTPKSPEATQHKGLPGCKEQR
jgi:4-amino-4-deoxy-L-arabinose transferase-like glycosyltransferase